MKLNQDPFYDILDGAGTKEDVYALINCFANDICVELKTLSSGIKRAINTPDLQLTQQDIKTLNELENTLFSSQCNLLKVIRLVRNVEKGRFHWTGKLTIFRQLLAANDLYWSGLVKGPDNKLKDVHDISDLTQDPHNKIQIYHKYNTGWFKPTITRDTLFLDCDEDDAHVDLSSQWKRLNYTVSEEEQDEPNS